MIVCFNFFETLALDPSLVQASYFRHFLKSVLSDLKTWSVRKLGLYKISFYFRGKDAMIKL